MITDHGYPRNTGIIQREIEISQRFFKNFLIGALSGLPSLVCRR